LNEEYRSIFYVERNFDKTVGSLTLPFLPEEHLYLSLGEYGSSVEIFEKILNEFGGYLVPNDCGDDVAEEFYKTIYGNCGFQPSKEKEELLAKLVGIGNMDRHTFLQLIEENKDLVKIYINTL